MEIRTGSIDFSAPLRGSGPRVESQTVVFPRPVVRAIAGLSGYTVAYSGDDQHVGKIQVLLDTTVNANTVIVDARFGLRDWSGDWDNNYDGTVDFVVIADLESATATPPRGDLIVTGMEFNQAVQFFRAASYLDPANVEPDNSIWLVADKNTGVRVYSDYDPSAGLAPISQLTGSLTVQTSYGPLTLNPINPNSAITPVRDVQINMGHVEHTLNFMIPAALCVGSVTVTCALWDLNSPNSTSARYSRTIDFTSVAPLNLYLVGINDQAVTPFVPAPSQADMASTLTGLIRAYPVGDVAQTGYTTLDFNETLTGHETDNRLADLLDRLNDLRGGSSDIYLGELPAGILNMTPPFVPGWATQGSKTAATFVDFKFPNTGKVGIDTDVSHEIGHCLGRHHTPCGPGCDHMPPDPDLYYPQYNSFSRESTGVYGFDPTQNVVYQPEQWADMMGYSMFPWISPYTYTGLRSAFPPTGEGPTPLAAPNFRTDGDLEVLFLGLAITRERKVTRIPSFHFPAKRLNRVRDGQFSVEFQDVQRQPLSCSRLPCGRDDDCDCWPKNIRDVVPFPQGSRWLVIFENDKVIYEEEIPPEPIVKIESAESTDAGVQLTWSAEYASELCYLVHWYDERANVWRGVAPRQQTTSLLIPERLFADSKELRVRVLATPGLSTGIAEQVVEMANREPLRPKVILLGVDTSRDKSMQIPNVLIAVMVDGAGRQLPDNGMTWYGDGKVIGKGKQVDLRSLEAGRHTVRLVNRGAAAVAATTWVIERNNTGFQLLHEASDPVPPRVGTVHEHPHPAPPNALND